MSKLDVYLSSAKVGSLEQDDSGLLQFCYDRSWLERPDAIALSRSLPLQSEVFSGKKARPFFAGILPEETPRKKIAQILGISAGNDFALLERLGGECAGAVSLIPGGTTPASPKNIPNHKLSDAELWKIIDELPKRPLLAGSEGMRLSLAGAQDKLPIVITGGGICLPLGGAASTHIMKTEPDRFPGLAANEVFCMALAQAVGLSVPDVEYRLVGNTPCILVQRYDRATDEEGNTTRLHQEDFCQALAYPPERKYQAEGGPAISDCISLLRDWSSVPVVDIPSFVDSVVFNVVIGNADAHGKNFSILYANGERRLSPGYDLVSTLSWPELSKNLAMKVGSCRSVNVFSIGDWRKMAGKTGLGWPMMRERMAANCQEILDKLDAIRERMRENNETMAGQLHETIGSRAGKMLETLSRQDG